MTITIAHTFLNPGSGRLQQASGRKISAMCGSKLSTPNSSQRWFLALILKRNSIYRPLDDHYDDRYCPHIVKPRQWAPSASFQEKKFPSVWVGVVDSKFIPQMVFSIDFEAELDLQAVGRSLWRSLSTKHSQTVAVGTCSKLSGEKIPQCVGRRCRL